MALWGRIGGAECLIRRAGSNVKIEAMVICGKECIQSVDRHLSVRIWKWHAEDSWACLIMSAVTIRQQWKRSGTEPMLARQKMVVDKTERGWMQAVAQIDDVKRRPLLQAD